MDTIYDIAMRDEDFVMYANGKPLYTPAGNEVAHTNARILRLAVTHELLREEQGLSPLSLLIRLTDILAGTSPVFEFSVSEKIENDPMLKKKENIPSGSSILVMPDNFLLVDYVFINSSSMVSAFNAFQYRKEQNQPISDYTAEFVSHMTTEQQMALNILVTGQNCGILVHLLFLCGYLSLSEYATGMIILKIKENDRDVSDTLHSSGIHGLAEIHRQFVEKAQTISNFLTLFKNENQISVIEEIIKRGENDQTEFKSTLRWDLRQSIKNTAIEHASLKTICAFLNSEGGDLLIGVRDDGSIEGIETDKFENDDRFLLHLWTLIKTCMGHEVVEWVNTSLQKFGDKTVCRVNCKRANRPVFLTQKGFDEAFFIRVGPSSSNLEISSALKYIRQHFN
ncbi:MAG: ATP-binding protein [Prolixibacteraceae bacterium]|nr:ATP-binding protein [Prolixibacteraceae bacterium]